MEASINSRLFISLFVIFFVCACNDGKRNGRFCKQLNDGLINCLSYENGILIKSESYEQDTVLKYGDFFDLSLKGDTLMKCYYRDGIKIGSYFEYFSNGHPKLYICFDSFHEDTMYYRAYHKNGKILKDGGEMFYEDYYTSVNTTRLQSDSVLSIWSILIAAPKTEFKVECFMYKYGSNDTMRAFNSYYEPYQNNLIFSTDFKLGSIGKYRVYVLTELYDPDKTITRKKVEAYDVSFNTGSKD